MFTGIIHTRGTLLESCSTESGRRLVIRPSGGSLAPRRGDSICVNGVCLTLVETPSDGLLAFDVVVETLEKTTLGGLKPGDEVNLEPSLSAGQALDGHVVQGHVDATSRVLELSPGADDYRIRIAIPSECQDWIVPKGSVTIDGVSLTVATLSDEFFEVALIPTTLELTTLSQRRVGDGVNIECDILAKTIAHLFHKYRQR
ncbi:MAG: riboflavin synthase [Phycisphaerales bacterium JB043]